MNTEEPTNEDNKPLTPPIHRPPAAHPADQLLHLDDHHIHHHDPESVLRRVGKIPLVSGVVRAYERGKDTSKMVRYGADLVESSVNSLSDTVVSRVGPERIAQIDRYAGAALDRLGQFNHQTHQVLYHHHHHHHYLDQFNPHQRSFDHSPPRQQSSSSPRHHQSSNYQSIYDDQVSDYTKCSNSTDSFHRHQLQDLDHTFQTSEDDHLDPEHHSTSLHPYRSPRPHRLVQVSTTTTTTTTTSTSSNSKSRWQNILVEAGMTAGGIGAAVSEESMKSLQYCLHWLHYATAHLDHQITVLRDLISSLNEEEEEESLTYGMRTLEAVTRLASIKKEVVETIRKVVDVVSKYARVGLPEPAKQFVRKSILGLPLRWASAIRVNPFINYSSDLHSGESPIEQPQSNIPPTNRSHTTTQIAAHRVLTFAVESLSMLKSITGTFSESVERADAWVQRLRVMGFQNRNNQDPGHLQQSQRQRRWESDWKDVEEDEEDGDEMSRTISTMKNKYGEELDLMQAKNPKPRSSSKGRYQQIPRVRSRSSSRSSIITCEEDNISLMSEKSMMSSRCCGCDMSTVGSLISSNTTLTPSCTSNHTHQFTHHDLPAGGSVDRSTAKRRKANGNLTNHHLQPIILDPQPSLSSPSKKMESIRISSESSCLDEEEEMKKDGEIWKDQSKMKLDHSNESRTLDSLNPTTCNNHSLSDSYILNTPPPPPLTSTHSNSLKKILLDSDQVNHLDLQLFSHVASSPAHIPLHHTS